MPAGADWRGRFMDGAAAHLTGGVEDKAYAAGFDASALAPGAWVKVFTIESVTSTEEVGGWLKKTDDGMAVYTPKCSISIHEEHKDSNEEEGINNSGKFFYRLVGGAADEQAANGTEDNDTMDLDEEESPESETEEEPKGEEKAAHLGVFQEHFYTYLRRALGSSGAPKKLVDALHFCKHANKVNISVPAVDVFDPSKSHPDTCFESPADRRTTQAPEGLAPTTSSVASLRAYWGLLYI